MGVKIVEPVPLLTRCRAEATALARALYHKPGRAAFRKRLDGLPEPAREEIRLSFGWLEEPRRAEEARIGGGVKLTHLRERFGESREGFNVLYLVSSLLHLVPHVEELVAWAKRRGVAVVWNQNGVAYPAWCGANYPWFNEPMRRLIAQADHVVYQSAFCRACADRYLGEVSAPAEVQWNPVDTRHFSPSAQAPPTNVWQLLAMGTNHSFYRVRASLETLRELLRRGISARLTIAGEMRWPEGDRGVSRTRATARSRAPAATLHAGGSSRALSPRARAPSSEIQGSLPDGADRGDGLRRSGRRLAQRGNARTRRVRGGTACGRAG
jgi:hypothetical protein